MKSIKILLIAVLCFITLTAEDCSHTNSSTESKNTLAIAKNMGERQPTPTDIDYSLERYNLIRRAYWVNGQREKARMIPCPIADIPLGYVVLFSENGTILGKFIVEGKVSSLNSFLTPDSEYYEFVTGSSSTYKNKWLPDVDGSYGTNDNGIFFFTPDGKYMEYTGKYLYTDIPMEVKNPVIQFEQK
jgi:hypothetical protein